jgi:hypothetical protein
MGIDRQRWSHDQLVFTRKRASIGAKPHLCAFASLREPTCFPPHGNHTVPIPLIAYYFMLQLVHRPWRAPVIPTASASRAREHKGRLGDREEKTMATANGDDVRCDQTHP